MNGDGDWEVGGWDSGISLRSGPAPAAGNVDGMGSDVKRVCDSDSDLGLGARDLAVLYVQ